MTDEVDRARSLFHNRLTDPCFIVGENPPASAATAFHKIASPVIFRANWFFLETTKNYGPRVDGYFCFLDNLELQARLTKIYAENEYQIEAVFHPFQSFGPIPHPANVSTAALDQWAILAANSTLARFLIGGQAPSDEMQMIAVAVMLGFRRIYTTGEIPQAESAANHHSPLETHEPETLQQRARTSDDLNIRFMQALRKHYEFELIDLRSPESCIPTIDIKKCPKIDPTAATRSNRRVYATLADGDYVIGAMALARSLAKVSNVPLLVLHTCPELPGILAHLPNVQTRKVDPIRNPHTHGQERFAGTFTKLQVFHLIEYDRVTFIDSDAIVLKSIDELFDMEGFCAAPDWGVNLTTGFNSGVFCFSPSIALAEKIFSALPNSQSSDGSDQGFLNWLFGTDVVWLSPEYNTLKRLSVHHPSLMNINECKVLHFVGDKPWDLRRMQPEFNFLETIWCSFLEKKDWLHYFWLNKKSFSKEHKTNEKALKSQIKRVSNITSLLRPSHQDILEASDKLRDQGNFSQAMKGYLVSALMNPRGDTPWLRLALCSQAQGEDHAQYIFALQALQQKPESKKANGLIQEAQGRCEKRQAYPVLLAEADTLLTAKSFAKAMTKYLSCALLAPRRAAPWIGLANCAKSSHEYTSFYIFAQMAGRVEPVAHGVEPLLREAEAIYKKSGWKKAAKALILRPFKGLRDK